MKLQHQPALEISAELLEAIRTMPAQREVEHCGVRFRISAFDFYAGCPQCGARIKVRSFSAHAAIEDIFDAVFEWMNHPEAQEIARSRQVALAVEE